MDAKVGEFYRRSRLTLDLADLNPSQRQRGLMYFRGGETEFVNPNDRFEYDQVRDVVFKWGDEKILDVFANLLEHKEPPMEGLRPFEVETVIGSQLWDLGLMGKEYDPDLDYDSSDDYTVLPFDQNQAAIILEEIRTMVRPETNKLGKIGTRYVKFEKPIDIGVSLADNVKTVLPDYSADFEAQSPS